MAIVIPEDWDELTQWMIDDVFDARDALIALQRAVADSHALMVKMLAELQWMSGSTDFAEGGVAHSGWTNGVQPLMAEVEAFLADD